MSILKFKHNLRTFFPRRKICKIFEKIYNGKLVQNMILFKLYFQKKNLCQNFLWNLKIWDLKERFWEQICCRKDKCFGKYKIQHLKNHLLKSKMSGQTNTISYILEVFPLCEKLIGRLQKNSNSFVQYDKKICRQNRLKMLQE